MTSTGNAPLVARLRDRIRKAGAIPFSEFMEAALYDPDDGYYCRPRATTGAEGDFYTSPDVHPAFGRLIARQIAQIADAAGPGPAGVFRIVEMGPGTGRLARDLVAGLVSERPDLASRTTLTLVEISPSLRASQKATLGGRCPEGLRGLEWASWTDLLGSAAEDFVGCVVANEFLDALPVHIVQQGRDGLREVFVEAGERGFTELLDEPSRPELAEHLNRLGVVLEEGQRGEIGLRALEWTGDLERLFGPRGRGGAIVIDYGYHARQLDDPGRGRGTLLCYRRHRAADDPLSHVGDQDMTAHVDFTSVERAARRAGFDVAPLTTQMHFLVALGLPQMLAEAASRPGTDLRAMKDRLALHELMAPGGMGEVFKVMLMTKGMPAAALTGARNPFREPAHTTEPEG